MEVLVVLITLAVITVVGILIFLAGRAIFEFIVEHSILKVIFIGLFALALADILGPEILFIVGVILLFKLAFYGIAWLISIIVPPEPPPDPMALYPKRRKENGEEEYKIQIDFDTYKDMFGNKYRYDRINDELIDQNNRRTKVSKVYEHDLKLTDSKDNPYDRIN